MVRPIDAAAPHDEVEWVASTVVPSAANPVAVNVPSMYGTLLKTAFQFIQRCVMEFMVRHPSMYFADVFGQDAQCRTIKK
jgi:hypothetical protein